MGNQSSLPKYWYNNTNEYQAEASILREIDTRTIQGFKELNDRGLTDNSLNYNMSTKYKLTGMQIWDKTITYGYVVLLYYYGRIAGLPNYREMLKHFKLYINEITLRDYSMESRHYIMGGIFPMPVKFDSEDWPPYYLGSLKEYMDVQTVFPTEIQKAFEMFLEFYGLRETEYRIEINDADRFRENYMMESFSRFVRVLFVAGLWGKKHFFVKFKYFVFSLYSNYAKQKGAQQHYQKYFSVLLLSRFYEKKESEASELFKTMKIALMNQKTTDLFANTNVNLSFQVEGNKKGKPVSETTDIRLFEDIISQLNSRRIINSGEGSWYLFNKDTGAMHEIKLSSRFLMEPVCWKNCDKKGSNITDNFKWYLVNTETGNNIASIPSDLFTNTKNYRFIYQTNTQLPTIPYKKPSKHQKPEKRLFEISLLNVQPSKLETKQIPSFEQYLGPEFLESPIFDEVGEFSDYQTMEKTMVNPKPETTAKNQRKVEFETAPDELKTFYTPFPEKKEEPLEEIEQNEPPIPEQVSPEFVPNSVPDVNLITTPMIPSTESILEGPYVPHPETQQLPPSNIYESNFVSTNPEVQQMEKQQEEEETIIPEAPPMPENYTTMKPTPREFITPEEKMVAMKGYSTPNKNEALLAQIRQGKSLKQVNPEEVKQNKYKSEQDKFLDELVKKFKRVDE